MFKMSKTNFKYLLALIINVNAYTVIRNGIPVSNLALSNR